MPFDLYHVAIPTLIRGLKNLDALLKKGEDYAAEKGVSPQTLLDSRLAPDMGNLIFQIQRASDFSKFTAVRVGGVANLSMEDNEKTFEDLHARIDKTIKYLEDVPVSALAGKEEAEVKWTLAGKELTFTGQSYVFNFMLPNVFFHITTAYDLLRAQGVPLIKQDYLTSGAGFS